MTNYLIAPGLGNSGPDHWQTYLENVGDNFNRINQNEWESPDCNDWIERIDKVVSAYDLSTVVLVGHSLGCAAIVHWAARYKRKIKGAMLVAPSDVEAPQYTFPTTGFSPIPLQRIIFKTIVVASANDPWISLERAMQFSDSWGSEFINIGDAGHINAASRHKEWNEGRIILDSLG